MTRMTPIASCPLPPYASAAAPRDGKEICIRALAASRSFRTYSRRRASAGACGSVLTRTDAAAPRLRIWALMTTMQTRSIHISHKEEETRPRMGDSLSFSWL